MNWSCCCWPIPQPRDLSHVCDLHCSSQQRQILKTLSGANAAWNPLHSIGIHCANVNHCATTGTPILLLDSVLLGFMSLESGPFLLGCQIRWCIIVHSILFFFCISELSVEISPFSFLILFIWVLFLFFFVSLARVLSALFTLSKNQFLVVL